MGGMVLPSPVPLFHQFEDNHGLQRGSIAAAINAGGERGKMKTSMGHEVLNKWYKGRFRGEVHGVCTLLPDITCSFLT